MICFLMGYGEYCGCLSSLVRWVLCDSWWCEVVLRFDVNIVNVLSEWYCVSFSFNVLEIFLMDLI